MSRPRVGRELQAIRRAKIWAAMSCKCLECCRRTKRRGEGKDGLVEGGTRKAEDKKERERRETKGGVTAVTRSD
jgi:hypothetical protein